MLRTHRGNGAGKFLMAGSAGLLVGLLANPARKIAVQAPAMLKHKAWDEALAAEHKATLAIVGRMAETGDEAAGRRAHLLAELKHAIGKHSFAEENTVYAQMRRRGLVAPAKALNEEHAEVKLLLFELTEMASDDPRWTRKVGELRAGLQHHMAAEEQEHFPRLRAALSEQENRDLAAAMNREALKLA